MASRLRERRTEIEHVVMARMRAVSDFSKKADPHYVDGLRAAVSAAIGFGIETIEIGADVPPPIPPALLLQARLAARTGISFDTVVRRYVAGYVLFGDFLIEESEGAGFSDGLPLRSAMRSPAALLDQLIEAVSREYAREAENRRSSSEERLAERVRRLLSGELLNPAGIDYDFEGSHIGVIAIGPGGSDEIRNIARVLDRRLLVVRPDPETVWAWLGGRQEIDISDLLELASDLPSEASIAIGETCGGITGWRLTHHQAGAAMPIAIRRGGAVTRYADVALLASALQDDLLTVSLRALYLEPLESGRGDGSVMRETLRAYLGSERNVSSAAAALGVTRHTVSSRLRAIEERVGLPISRCAIEIDLAMRLSDLDALHPDSDRIVGG